MQSTSDLRTALAAVDETKIPVMSRDRHIPRKEQAALARKLFKQLGLKGISVTTPNYSMAQSVDVALPRIPFEASDYVLDGVDYQNHSFSDMPPSVPVKIKMAERTAMRLSVQEILARAFPAHDNRSDYQSDYFDYCWSFD